VPVGFDTSLNAVGGGHTGGVAPCPKSAVGGGLTGGFAPCAVKE